MPRSAPSRFPLPGPTVKSFDVGRGGEGKVGSTARSITSYLNQSVQDPRSHVPYKSVLLRDDGRGLTRLTSDFFLLATPVLTMVRSTLMLRQAAQALTRHPHPTLNLSSAVRSALTPSSRAPVVALESTIITHGLPYPYNLEVAQELEQTVVDNGAVPATVALLDGKPLVGLDQQQLERLAQCAIDPSRNQAIKASRRDLAHVLAKGKDTVGGTTVSGTMVLAHMAGIPIFATGGIGGVHRNAESSKFFFVKCPARRSRTTRRADPSCAACSPCLHDL